MDKILFVLLLSMFHAVAAQAEEMPQGGMEEKTSTQSYFVGELGAAWQFPSDHLPVGGSIGNIHFALWNTLNTKYLHWVEENEQGLKDSLILQANVPISEDDKLTVREDIVAGYIMKMLQHPTQPRSILAIEEVGQSLYNSLSLRLPDYMQIYPGKADEQKLQDLFIVDTRMFDILDCDISKYSFKENTIVKLLLREKNTGLKYCFIQSHVPGGPANSLPARIEFAGKVMKEYNPENIFIVLGDMNRSADYFLPHFAQAAREMGLETQPFVVMDIPYPTHVDTHLEASWIDNIFIANPYFQIESHPSSGMELLEDVQPTLELLESLRPRNSK